MKWNCTHLLQKPIDNICIELSLITVSCFAFTLTFWQNSWENGISLAIPFGLIMHSNQENTKENLVNIIFPAQHYVNSHIWETSRITEYLTCKIKNIIDKIALKNDNIWLFQFGLFSWQSGRCCKKSRIYMNNI